MKAWIIILWFGLVASEELQFQCNVCKVNAAGRKVCTFSGNVGNNSLQDLPLPNEVCINDNCANCITGWKSYFATNEKKIYSYSKARSKEIPSINNKTKGQYYECKLTDQQQCNCNYKKCSGNELYCKSMPCQPDPCYCTIKKATIETIAQDPDTEFEYKNPWLISCLVCITDKHPLNNLRRQVRSLDAIINEPDSMEGSTETSVKEKSNQESTQEQGILKFKKQQTIITYKQPIFLSNKAGTIILRTNNMQTILKFLTPQASVIIPPEFLVHDGILTFTFLGTNGILLEGQTPIKANDLCFKLQCIFCPQIYNHLTCLPNHLKLILIGSAVIMIGIIIKYLRAILKFVFEVIFSLYFATRMVMYFTKRLARFCMALGVISGEKLKKKSHTLEQAVVEAGQKVPIQLNPSTVISVNVIFISLILFPVVLGVDNCDTYQMIQAKTKTCDTNLDTNCSISAQARISIKNLKGTACLYFEDKNNNFLAGLVMEYDSVHCLLDYETIYYTFPTQLKVSSAIHCPQNEYCGWLNHCKKGTYSPLISDEAGKYPGQTSCFPIEPSESDCTILHADGCLMYRYYLVPDLTQSYRVNEIKGMTCWPRIKTTLTTGDEIRTGYIEKKVFKQLGLQLEVIGNFMKSYTPLNEKLVTSFLSEVAYLVPASDKGKPNYRKIGNIQTSSFNFKNGNVALGDTVYDDTGISCQPHVDSVQCQQKSNPIYEMSSSSEGKLPVVKGFYEFYQDTQKSVIKAKALDPGAVELFLKFKNYDIKLAIKRVCPELLSISDIRGCYGCSLGASLAIYAKSLCDAGWVRIHFEGMKLTTLVVDLTSQKSRHIIKFSSSAKCFNHELCLQSAEYSSCKLIEHCLDEPEIKITPHNTSTVTSISKFAKDLSFSSIFGFFTKPWKMLVMLATTLVVGLAILYCISLILSMMRS